MTHVPMPTITGLVSMAVRHLLADLADDYRSRTGQVVGITAIGGVDAARRVRAGDAFDFTALSAEAIDALAAEGHVVGERVDLARSPIAVAVRSGAPRPDLRDEAAVRDAVLAAARVGYSSGPSGVYLERMFRGWDDGGALAPRLAKAPPGIPVASLIARGEVDLGFQQLSEMIHETGIDIVGPLPPSLQLVTVFSAAVCATASAPDDARAWLAFLASPDADAAKRRHGLEPVGHGGPPAR